MDYGESPSSSDIRQPVFVVGSCREMNKCSPDVANALLHKISTASGFSSRQRAAALRWVMDECGLSFPGELEPEILANRMPGFRFGDLNAVVSIAARCATF